MDDEPIDGGFVAEIADAQLHPPPRAVRVQCADLGGEAGIELAVEGVPLLDAAREVVGVDEFERVRGAEGLGVVAENVFDGWARVADESTGIDDADDVDRVAQEGLIPLLALAERQFRVLLVGDVAARQCNAVVNLDELLADPSSRDPRMVDRVLDAARSTGLDDASIPSEEHLLVLGRKVRAHELVQHLVDRYPEEGRCVLVRDADDEVNDLAGLISDCVHQHQ